MSSCANHSGAVTATSPPGYTATEIPFALRLLRKEYSTEVSARIMLLFCPAACIDYPGIFRPDRRDKPGVLSSPKPPSSIPCEEVEGQREFPLPCIQAVRLPLLLRCGWRMKTLRNSFIRARTHYFACFFVKDNDLGGYDLQMAPGNLRKTRHL